MKLGKNTSSPETIVFVDKSYLLKQLHRFKLLILIYFFSQLYSIIKNLFFVLLNNDYGENNRICLSLYGKEKEIVFYDFFDKETSFFILVEIAEYFFRVVFCYFVPIIMILFIVKAEFDYVKDASLMSLTSDSVVKDDLGDDFIPGLKFNYNK